MVFGFLRNFHFSILGIFTATKKINYFMNKFKVKHKTCIHTATSSSTSVPAQGNSTAKTTILTTTTSQTGDSQVFVLMLASLRLHFLLFILKKHVKQYFWGSLFAVPALVYSSYGEGSWHIVSIIQLSVSILKFKWEQVAMVIYCKVYLCAIWQ